MPDTDASARNKDLRWPRSLGFKLMLLMLLLLAMLGASGFHAAQYLLGDRLASDIENYESAGSRRLGEQLNSLALRMESLADIYSRLAVSSGGGAALRPSAPALLEGQNLGPLISALGFWPEPNSLDIARDRASSYWVVGSSGKLEAREGYNDPRAVPYYREPWYTPARYAPAGRCYWTPAYYEPLVKREIISCAMAMRSGGRFTGVVTLSISLGQLGKLLEQAAAGDAGYSLLVDAHGQILSVSSAALPVIERGGRPRNFAELAQRLPAFNPLAIEVHQQEERQHLAAGADKPAIPAKDIAELKNATRDFVQADAERVLAHVVALPGEMDTGNPVRVALGADPVLGAATTGLLTRVPASGWGLIRVLPANAGLPGARQLFVQTLQLAGGLAGVLLLLLMLALSLLVFGPLRRVVRQLAGAKNGEAALELELDESSRNELGALSFWINERSRQLREMLDRVNASHLQLGIEAKDRRAVIDQLTRYQERAAPALLAVTDAVIATDEQGFIEDMNPAAEQLTGVSLAAARNRPLADIVNARSTTSDVTVATAVLTAMQRGTQIDPREDFRLRGAGNATHDVHLKIIPVRTRGNRLSGTVLVLRDKSGSAPAAVEPIRSEVVSTLPRRGACEKRIKELIEAARAKPRRHSALVVDLDQLRRINETAGRSAGDDAVRRLGDILSEKTGNLGEVFYLHADRYAVVLSDFDSARARTFAEALRESVAHQRLGGGPRSVGLTVSIGLVEFGGEAVPDDTLPRAEDACATAKRGGRNSVRVYESGMVRAERDVDDALWVRRIRAGIDRNMLHLTTQFVSSVQPAAAEIAMFASMLALEDEEGFWSEATRFMPAAERHGLAAAVDRWHIGGIAAQLARGGDTLNRVAMTSIRISQSSLFDPELPDFLIELMERHQALSGRLCLELTESSILGYPQQAHSLGEVLRIIGVRLAISDFLGRDPMTLTQLRQLPAEFVRMDAKRFRSIGSDPVEQKLADSVLQLARSMKKQTWIFGIDEPAHLDIWRRLNADHYQGLAVAKPSPVPFQLPR